MYLGCARACKCIGCLGITKHETCELFSRIAITTNNFPADLLVLRQLLGLCWYIPGSLTFIYYHLLFIFAVVLLTWAQNNYGHVPKTRNHNTSAYSLRLWHASQDRDMRENVESAGGVAWSGFQLPSSSERKCKYLMICLYYQHAA